MQEILVKANNSLRRLVTGGVSPASYWNRRAVVYGRRGVLNLGHSDEEFEAVTKRQREEIFPWLGRMLAGTESVVLDLGCGPGRFSGALAERIHGRVIAVDPVADYLRMAPAHPFVEYRQLNGGRVPLADGAVDLVWVCLVLGGLKGRILRRALLEMDRVLRPGGLLFLVENTSEAPSPQHWEFRSFEAYKDLVPFVSLRNLWAYDDLGETISVMAGRKC